MRPSIRVLSLYLLLSASAMAADSDSQTQFYLNLSDYYAVEGDQIEEMAQLGLEDEDLAVLFKIAIEAVANPREIADLYFSGSSWEVIASEYELGPIDFYVDVPGTIESQNYLPIFAKYRVTPRAQWEMISLSDADIRSLANLEFLSEYYGYSPYQIMAMRDYGKSFVLISSQIELAKSDMARRELAEKKSLGQSEQN